MSKENQLRLYKHFLETNQDVNAKAILEVYPEFDKKEEIKEESKKEKNKKK